jgi:hypothetical protein
MTTEQLEQKVGQWLVLLVSPQDSCELAGRNVPVILVTVASRAI